MQIRHLLPVFQTLPRETPATFKHTAMAIDDDDDDDDDADDDDGDGDDGGVMVLW